MDNIWFGELIVASVCILAITTRHVFLDTRNIGRAFLAGFAYPAFFVSLTFLYLYVPEKWIPRAMDREIFSVLMSAIILAVFVSGHQLFWMIRRLLIKTYRVVRKAWRTRNISWGLWGVSHSRKKQRGL